MSDQPAPSASVPQPSADRPAAEPTRPAPPVPPKPPRPPKAPSPRRGGALAVLAFLLALLALACIAYGGWHWWQSRSARQQASASVAHLHQQVDALQHTLATEQHQRETQRQEKQALQADNRSLQQQVDGMSGRVQSLESAVAALAQQGRDGHQAMVLDQVAMLLRMGQQRYALFHDAEGAIRALDLADQALAAVNDPALAGVRQTLDEERKALANTHPASRASDLAALAHLRSVMGSLPLKPLDSDDQPVERGFWQRVWHAVSTAVVIRRDDGSVQSLTDARLARRLAALNVAEAEAARLAWNAKASHAALERVATSLQTVFDPHDAEVRKAQAEVARLLAEPPATPAHLGKALQELQNVRRVHDAATPTPPAGHAGAPT